VILTFTSYLTARYEIHSFLILEFMSIL